MLRLSDTLKEQFNSAQAENLDITVAFTWPDGECRVGLHGGDVNFFDDLSQAPAAELIIYFRDETLATEILCGRYSPIDAFMRGEFRSNGYLMWVFQSLQAFSKAP